MNTLLFLEQMASSVHHDNNLNKLIVMQTTKVATAYKTNDSDLLKKHLGEAEFIANSSEVVQF